MVKTAEYKEYTVYADGRVWRQARAITRSDGVTRRFRGAWVCTRIRNASKGTGGGYVYIDLYVLGVEGYGIEHWLLHRLVATSFLPNPDNLRDVNHKDGVRHHNNVRNLEWMSRSDNQKHAYETGIRGYHGMSSEKAVAIWRARNVDKRPLLDVAAEFNVPFQSVSRIANGGHHAVKSWLHQKL